MTEIPVSPFELIYLILSAVTLYVIWKNGNKK